ncbi:MAG: mechanosensitive ion channel family protein [Ilumatobacteraceae bacterium]
MPPALTAATRPGWIERLDELHLLTPLRVVVIVLVAWIVARVLRVVIVRAIGRSLVLLPGADASRTEARRRALSAALRSAVVGVVWATAAITVISEFGINIGAFVATATVVGAAVAFGAQQLMRDLIAGFFVLAEDQFGVGDRVDLGVVAGTVERITLRAVRLRDDRGVVWHVAHGGVATVANLSKAPGVTMDIEVSRSMTLRAVDAETEDLCAALRVAVGDRLTGAAVVTGIVAVRDDRYVVRLVAPTLAEHQSIVADRWRRIALEAFEGGRLSRP